MTCELQSTLHATGIQWPALRNPIPCMPHVIQHAFGAFISRHSVLCGKKSWEAYVCDQQYSGDEIIHIGQRQTLQKEGNAGINNFSAMRPGLAQIIGKVDISSIFPSPEPDLDRPENGCHNGYVDTWSSKRVHSLSHSQSVHCSTPSYRCEDTGEFESGVAWVRQPITRIHPCMAPESTMQWFPATLHNTGGTNQCQAYYGWLEAIPLVDPVDVETAYGNSVSDYRYQQWPVQWYGWR